MADIYTYALAKKVLGPSYAMTAVSDIQASRSLIDQNVYQAVISVTLVIL